MIKCAYRNILETSTVSLSAGTAHADYPLYRAYDRDVGRIFKPTAAETIEVLASVNRITNPGAETGDATGWDLANATIETTDPAEGTYHFQLVASGSDAYGPNQQVPFDQSKTYRVLAKYKIPSYTAGYWYFRIYFADANGDSIVGTEKTLAAVSATTANYAQIDKTIGPTGSGADFEGFPAGAVYMWAYGLWAGSPTGIAYLDDVVIYDIEEGTADRLIIPAGHNLGGLTLSLWHSDDSYNGTSVFGYWIPNVGLINKSFTSTHHPYWHFVISNPTYIPQFAELFLTSTYEWERNPTRPTGPLDDVHNVEHGQTFAGQDRFLVRGSPKRQRVYQMPRCGEAQKDNIAALFSNWAGAKPFWLEDHEGAWIFGRLRGPLNLREIASQAYSFDFDFLEVLP